MSEPAWTPGPWRWADWDSGILMAGENDIILWPHNATETGHAAGWLGACGLTAEPLAEANARLISAAPELYEALKEAELQIEYLHDKFQRTGTGEAAIARIRAALAKARGDE